jgi:predicted patatin/cPLA2 family phospholipase
MKTALVLEGGGMRGIYTAGVLDYFMEQQLQFYDVIGVSAGALNALSYKSNQPQRSYDITMKYSMDKRYVSLRSLIKTRNMFGVKFIFETIPNELLPFDYETYEMSPIRLWAVVTNLQTGKAEYPEIKEVKEDQRFLIATSSLPMISRTVHTEGTSYLDGGAADPIPIDFSITQGYDKHVVVLTREESYRKKPSRMLKLVRIRYKKYPKFVELMEQRADRYNQTIENIQQLEQQRKAFVIRPSRPVVIDRYERDPEKLNSLYQLGYKDAQNQFGSLLEFIKGSYNVFQETKKSTG